MSAGGHFALWHDKLAWRTFQDGLVEPLRLLIKARNYTDFSEAVNGAFEEELYLNPKRVEKQYNNNNKSHITCFRW